MFNGEAPAEADTPTAATSFFTAKKRRQAVLAPSTASSSGSAPSTPCQIVVNVDGLSAEQQTLLQTLHESLGAYPCLDGGIAPRAAALDAYTAVVPWLRANLCMTGDAYELDLEKLLSMVHADAGLSAVTPFILAAACVELGIADAPTGSWCAANMGRLGKWLVRACMWDLRACRTLRGSAAWHTDTDRRAFYQGIIEHARHAGFAVYTHGHMGILHVVREYFELQRTEAAPGTTRVRKTAWDAAAHTFTLTRNALALVQARSADALDGLAAPLRALPPRRAFISDALRTFLDTAAPHAVVTAAHVDELRTLCKPYAWLFGAAHGLAEDTYELSFARGCPPAWIHVLVFWDAL